ncbi:MAG TPA: transcription termination/antitermination protein NusA [Firmicutes bacterium]|jgi:N utilization substance protein A|nr:transcription termination/antitermination protein NusA [Bacillota bacterium]
MNSELFRALAELEKERGIAKDILLDAIETAIVSAYKKNYGASSAANVRVELNEQTGAIRVYARKVVVEEVTDETTEVSLAEAQELDPNYAVGDIVEEEVTPRDFGRIAAQNAKQVVIQKIREAERSIIYNEYANRAGDVVTGIVQRYEYRNVIVDLGNVEAVLPVSEQIPREEYPQHARMKFYINEVKQSTKGPQIFLSRTHPGLLRNLFELEVPEIQSGEVEIKAVAREAGNRSKIAVYSRDPNIDPVGACVGARGSRVQAVVGELSNEKIDVVQWVSDPEEFIKNALSPAKVFYVRIDEENKVAHTVVPDDQLSLAIGKEGQNARLAARLTGWRIDIKSISQAEEFFAQLKAEEEARREAEPEAQLVEEAEEELDAVVEPELETAEEGAEVEKEAPILPEESPETPAEPEKGPEKEPEPVEIDPEELANLTNITKRKSWEERFGAAGLSASEQPETSSQPKEKQETTKSKRKKKEKVITDLSQLDWSDFGFGSEE